MAASYPSSVVSLATINNGDTSDASNINTPNAEIVAIETGLLNGFQHDLKPLANIGNSLGASAKRWLKVWTQDLDLSGTLTIASPLVATSGGTGLASGTSGGILGFTSTTAIASSALLVANAPVIGGGAGATPTSIATAGNAGQVFAGVGTGGVPAFVGGMTLLKANSGTDTSAGATNVDTVAISGLTALDTLIIKHTVESVTAQTAGARIYNTTDTVTITQIHAGAAVAAAAGSIGDVIIQARQGSTTAIAAACKSGTFANGSGDTSTVATFTTAWTGSWTLALRHDGVTATGTFKWKWAVYRLAGQ